MKIPNNQDTIAVKLESFGKTVDMRVTAVGDDGNVIVNTPGRYVQKRVAKMASDWYGCTAVGDGGQRGDILIMCEGFDPIEIDGTRTGWIDELPDTISAI